MLTTVLRWDISTNDSILKKTKFHIRATSKACDAGKVTMLYLHLKNNF